jgi:vacuolar-type H+-ATPase subunit I/STV1
LVGVLEKETKKQKTIVCVFVEGNSRGKIEKGKRKIAIPICSIPKRKKKKERNHSQNHYKRKKERRSFKTNKP